MTVEAIAARAAATVSIRAPMLRDVFDYWATKWAAAMLTGEGGPPTRREIDPLELKPLLPHLLMADIEREPLRFRFRLVGTSICRHYGSDYTGRYLDQLDLDDHDADIQAQYTDVATTGRPRSDLLRYVMDSGRARSYERLLLPLSDDGVRVTAIFGAQCDFSV